MASRRKFLQQISMAAAVAPVLKLDQGKNILLPNPPADGKKLRVALCGLGYYATQQLLPGILKSSNCTFAGIVTGTPAKKEKYQKEYNLPDHCCYNYQNFDDIKNNPDIDAVYIVLPNSMHKEYTLRTAKAGKHVICEKPMSVNTAEGKEMIAACKAAGVTLSIGYRLHYEPFTMEVMRLAKDKDYGKVKYVEAQFAFKNRNVDAWRMKQSLAGGGAIMDVGVYCINAARYATGEEPIAVTAQATKTEPLIYKDIEETLQWQLYFPSGAVSHGMSSYAFGSEKLCIHYENEVVELAPAYSYGPLKATARRAGPLNLEVVHHQAKQMEGIADSILNSKPIKTPGEEGLKDMIIVDAIKKAAKSGKKVKITGLV
jgi:predicted dehydrogenase